MEIFEVYGFPSNFVVKWPLDFYFFLISKSYLLNPPNSHSMRWLLLVKDFRIKLYKTYLKHKSINFSTTFFYLRNLSNIYTEKCLRSFFWSFLLFSSSSISIALQSRYVTVWTLLFSNIQYIYLTKENDNMHSISSQKYFHLIMPK